MIIVEDKSKNIIFPKNITITDESIRDNYTDSIKHFNPCR